MKKENKSKKKELLQTTGVIPDIMSTEFNNKFSYQPLTLEMIEKTMTELFMKREEPKERVYKIYCWQGGYDLFCEAMKKKGFELPKAADDDIERFFQK